MSDADKSKSNEEFQRRLVETLDHSLDDFDPDTLARLEQQRRQALRLEHKRRFLPSKQPLWAASAAAVLLVAALPWFFSPGQENDFTSPESPIAAEYYSVDPEMLEVMDMLIAWGELAEDEPNGF